MSEDYKIHENRLRRMAERQLLRLEKSRRRDTRAADYGRYQLVDESNVVVLGASQHEYECTLDEIERFLTDDKRGRWQKGKNGQARWSVPATLTDKHAARRQPGDADVASKK
ncbi:MAG: hypothetical protein QOF70_4006 [Acetobacteraceae bacterium]|jgi:hypothetical protein|nr:hypothetical protein [Acetobacteraceae bacterium]